MRFGARGPTRRRHPWRHVLPYFLEYAKPDPDRAPGGRRARSRLNREVGGETDRTLSGGPDTIRPRSRSDSDPSDGGGAAQRDCGRSSFRELDGSPPSRLPVGDARPSVRIRASSATPGKAGGVTNGHRFHHRAIRDLGVVPKFRAVSASPSTESALPPPFQSSDVTRRRRRRGAGCGRWIGLCMFHSDEACAGYATPQSWCARGKETFDATSHYSAGAVVRWRRRLLRVFALGGRRGSGDLRDGPARGGARVPARRVALTAVGSSGTRGNGGCPYADSRPLTQARSPSPATDGVEAMSLITILMFLAIAAAVCLVVHLLTRDKVPLWVAVALLCLIELLRTLPLGRY